jgi:SAM-dependent methyltransferase
MFECSICGSHQQAASYAVREMHLGTRAEYRYHACGNCGCLQIDQLPDTPATYYPADYYAKKTRQVKTTDRLLGYFSQKRLQHHLGEPTAIGAVLMQLLGPPRLPDWTRLAPLKGSDKILDVGCGTGRRILSLRKKGFRNLTGIDPYIERSIFYRNGVRVYKCRLEEMDGQFNFIMLHHSLEHIRDQQNAMAHVFRLLKDKGAVLVRMPLVSSYAWRHYRENWVQLDAPRHVILHSTDSFRHLASASGFVISDIVYDSTEFQFIGSEQYARDIALNSQRALKKDNIDRSIFTVADLKKFAEKARALNRKKEGDQACFVLSKKKV